MCSTQTRKYYSQTNSIQLEYKEEEENSIGEKKMISLHVLLKYFELFVSHFLSLFFLQIDTLIHGKLSRC